MPKLSATTVKSAVFDPTQGKTQYLWDDEISGFGVRLYPSGLKSWVVGYRRKTDGLYRIAVLGQVGRLTLDQARDLARERFYAVASGRDPAEELRKVRRKLRTAPLVEDLHRRYMADYAIPHKRKVSSVEDDRLFRTVVLPALSVLRVEEVDRDEITRLHLRIGSPPPAGQGKPVLANRVLALLSKAFQLAEEWKWREENSNPCRRVLKFPEAPRGKRLKEDELGRLWSALAQAEQGADLAWETVAFFRLLILTGARPGEISHLEKAWIDLDSCCIRLPIAKADRGQGRRTGRDIYLSPLAMAALQNACERDSTSPMVLPGSKPGVRRTFKKAWNHLCKRAEISGYRVDDLRHTFISLGGKGEVAIEDMQKLAGHRKITTTTAIYRHHEHQELVDAASSMGAFHARLFGVEGVSLLEDSAGGPRSSGK